MPHQAQAQGLYHDKKFMTSGARFGSHKLGRDSGGKEVALVPGEVEVMVVVG
jgi:hypothetical protein